MPAISRLVLPLQLNLSANVLTEYPEAGLLGDSKLCHDNNESCVLWLLTSYSLLKSNLTQNV